VNNDGEVTVEDAQITLIEYVNVMSGLEQSFTAKQLLAGDINGDKEITVEDAQFILLYYVNNTLSGTPVTWDELLEKPVQTMPRLLKKRIFSPLIVTESLRK
jgi:hypothetical protein